MQILKQNIINLYGEKGRQWLDHLPSLIAQAAETYGLSSLKPVNNLSYYYVLSGFQGCQPIILKLGLDIDGLKREVTALMTFSGLGVRDM
jgi:streptomycin 6-kinase